MKIFLKDYKHNQYTIKNAVFKDQKQEILVKGYDKQTLYLIFD